ncbi:MAG TPA: hypothetical protein VFI84_04105 [Candidatus Saccharimonadales bacterium]|nr:hypothetical protein [Candidatus Saccharimonadales bacterium]
MNEAGDTGNEQPKPGWQFKPGDTVISGQVDDPAPSPAAEETEPAAVAIPPAGPEGSISWTASEFIAHDKSAGWYLMLGGATIALAAIIWLVTKDKISAGVVVFGAALFGIYAARKPRQLQYQLDSSGLTIGQRHFVYHDFRSFSVVPEGGINSIVLSPLKRFAPLTTIYYDPADEDKIVALLSDRLPVERRQKDLVDRLMWRIRF